MRLYSNNNTQAEIGGNSNKTRYQRPQTSTLLRRAAKVVGSSLLPFLLFLQWRHQPRQQPQPMDDVDVVKKAIIRAPPQTTEKTTIVLLGYPPERINNYRKILTTYGAMDDVIDKVIFLWNNVNVSPPTPPTNTKVPIELWPQKENNMNNRFGADATQSATTESLLLVDDDMILSSTIIRAMIDEWVHSHQKVEFRPIFGKKGSARFVGCKEGYQFPCNNNKLVKPYCWEAFLSSLLFGKNNGDWADRYNLVLGKTMLFSKLFAKMYQEDNVIWKYTGPGGMKCEDIMMNALVRNATGSGPLFVSLPLDDDEREKEEEVQWLQQQVWQGTTTMEAEQGTIINKTATTKQELDSGGGLSKNPTKGSWRTERSQCVRWACRYYHSDIWK